MLFRTFFFFLVGFLVLQQCRLRSQCRSGCCAPTRHRRRDRNSHSRSVFSLETLNFQEVATLTSRRALL